MRVFPDCPSGAFPQYHMRIAALVGLVAALAMTGCGESVRPTASWPDLRVLTYNIHHGEGEDGRFDLERLAEVIRSVAPDLVALQEVDRRTTRSSGVDQAAELGRLTGLYHVFGKAMDFQGGGYGEAILSRIPPLKTRNHPLSAAAGHEPRALLEVVIEPHGPGTAIRFFATHLDHQTEEQRLDQMEQIAEIAGADPSPMILAGDLNARPGSPPITLLSASWIEATNQPGLLTFPSKNPRVKIDYVFYRPAGAFKVVSVKALDEPIASDHCPVLVELRFQPEAVER